MLPVDASAHGHVVDGVMRYVGVATGLCFVVMAAILLWAAAFHRQGRARARYTKGDGRRDRLLTIFTAGAIFFGIDVVSLVRASDHLRGVVWAYPGASAPGVERIEVTAQQWAWNFRHPGPDGRFGTPDDVVSLGELHVPAGRPVHFKIRSKDVIHSFYLPNFRNKVDAIPGNVTQLWVEPRVPGRYEIGCAQHCGVSHYKMRAELVVDTPEDYARWLALSAADAARRYDPADVEAHDAWAWEPAARPPVQP